ncbi:MAG: hypothetical protein JXA15_03125 [Spirochaetales bacterium]|nr:hypothetical protein [Spirochaetales bacterium]
MLVSTIVAATSAGAFAQVDVLFSEDFADETLGAVTPSAIPWTPAGSASPDWENSLTNAANANVFSVVTTDPAVTVNATNKLQFSITTAGTSVLLGAGFDPGTQRYVTVEYDVLLSGTFPINNPAGEIFYSDSTATLTSATPKVAIHVQFSDKDTVADDSAGENEAMYRTTGQDGNVGTDEGNEWRLFGTADWALDTWYRVRVVADQVSGTFDIGVTRLADMSLLGSATGLPYNDAGAGLIRKVWFAMTATNPTLYLDNVVVYQDSVAPPVSGPTIVVNMTDLGLVASNPADLDVDFFDDVDLAAAEYQIDSGDPAGAWASLTTGGGVTPVDLSGGANTSYVNVARIPTAVFDALGDGAHAGHFRAVDNLGNTTYATVTAGFVKDATPPEVLVTQPASGTATYYASIPGGYLSGTVLDAIAGVGANTVSVRIYRSNTSQYWNGSAWQAGAISLACANAALAAGVTGSWSYNFAVSGLVAGDTLQLVAFATDLAGNVSAGSPAATITLVAGAPYYNVNQSSYGPLPANAGLDVDFYDDIDIDALEYQFDGTAGAWAALTSDGATPLGDATLATSYTAALRVPDLVFAALPDGSHELYLRVYDGTSYVVAGPLSFKKDASAPVAVLTAPGSDPFGELTTVAGTVADAAGGFGFAADSTRVRIMRQTDSNYWNGSAWQVGAFDLPTTHAATTDSSSVAWTRAFALPSIATGTDYTFSVITLDSTGNTRTDTWTDYTYDATNWSWTGASSTDWFYAGNWDRLSVPPAGTAFVTIPVGKARYPVLNAAVSVATLSIQSGASLDLNGWDLSLSGAYSNAGTLILTGDETLTGFTQDTDSGLTRYKAGGTGFAGLSSFFDVEFAGGTRTLGAPLDANGSFILSAGSLDASGRALVVGGDFSVTGTAVLVIDGTSSLALDGAAAATLTTSSSGADVLPSLTAGSGVAKSVSLGSSVAVAGNLSVAASATFSAGVYDIALDGNFSNAGVFDPGTGALDLANASVATTISGSSDFHDLTSSAAGKTIRFTAGTTQTVRNSFGIAGSAGNLIVLESTVAGSQWTLAADDAAGAYAVDYASIRDSAVSDAFAMVIAPTNSLNLGNNDTLGAGRWVFPIYEWDGSQLTSDWTDGLNWVGDLAPPNDGSASILVAAGSPAWPRLPDADWSIDDLELEPGAVLSLGANDLSVGGVVTNAGTIIITGAGRPSGNDATQGLVRYTASGGVVADFGATDYYDLELAPAVASTFARSAASGVALAVANALTVGANATLDLDANDFSAASLSNAGVVVLEGSQTVALAANDTGSGAWRYDGATGPYTVQDFGAGVDYFDLELAGAGTFQPGGAVLDLADDLYLGAGTLAMGGSQLAVAGDISRGSGVISSTGTVLLDGSGAQSVDFSGSTLSTLSVANTGSVTTDGSFTAANFSKTLTGGFTLSAADTLTVTTAFSAGAGTVTLDGAYSGGLASFDVAGAAVSVGALAFASGDMTVSSGSFTQDGLNAPLGNQTLASLDVALGATVTWDSGSNGGDLAIVGDLSNAGTLAFNAKDVSTGGSMSGAVTLLDLTIPAGRTLTRTAGSSLVVLRHFTIEDTASYVNSGQPLTLGGSTITNGTIRDENSDTPENLGSVSFVPGGAATIKTLGTPVLATSISIGADVTLDAASFDVTAGGNLGGAGTLSASGAQTIAVGGNFTPGAFNSGASLVLLDGATPAISAGAFAYNDLEVAKSLGTDTVSLASGASVAGGLTVTAGTLSLGGDLSVSGAVTNAGTIAVGGSAFSFAGYSGLSGAVAVSGGSLTNTGAASTITTLTVTTGAGIDGGANGIAVTNPVSNAITTDGVVALRGTGITTLTVNSGTLSASGAVTVSGNVVLSAGSFDLAANPLTLSGPTSSITRGTGTLSSAGAVSFTGTGAQTADFAGSTLGSATISASKTGGSLAFSSGFSAAAFAIGANKAFGLSFNTAPAQSTSISGAATFDNSGALTLGDDAGDSFSAALGIGESSGGIVTLAGSVSATDAAISFGDLTLAAATTLDSGNGPAGTIALGAVTSGGNSLSLDSGSTAGATITLGSMVNLAGGLSIVDSGGAVAIGAAGSGGAGPLIVTQARAGVAFSGNLNATSLTITDTTGAVTFADGQTVSLGSLVTAGQDYSVIVNSSSFAVAADTSFLNTGALTLGNGAADALSFAAGLDTTTGPFTTGLAGIVSTTDSAMDLGPTTMGANATLRSGSGSIAVASLTDGAASYALSLGSGTQTGAIAFSGDLAVASLVSFSSNYAIAFRGASTTVDVGHAFLNSGALVLGDGADALVFTGGISHTAGSTELNGALSTANAGVAFGVLALSGDSSIDTDTGAGTVQLAGLGGAHDLLVSAGTGTVLVTGAVGDGTAPGNLGSGIGPALDTTGTTGPVEFAGSVDANSGFTIPGLAVFRGDANFGQVLAGDTGTTLSGAATLDGLSLASNQAVSFGNAVTLSGGAVSIATSANDSGVAFASTVAGNQPLSVTTHGAGVVALNGDVTLTGAAAGTNLFVSTASLSFSASVDASTVNRDIELYVDGLSLGGANTISAGTANLSIAPRTTALSVEFAPTDDPALATDVYIDSDFANIVAGSFTLGRATHAGAIHVGNSLGAVDADGYDLSVLSDGAVFVRNDYLAATGNRSLTLDSGAAGVAFVEGSGIAQSIALGSGALAVSDAARLDADLAIGATGGVLFASTLDGTSPGADDLAVTAGAGSVLFSGTVGGTPLGALSVLSANAGLVASFGIDAASVAIAAGGPVDLNGPVTAPGGFSSTGTGFDNSGATITTTDAPLSIVHSGNVIVGSALSSGTGALSARSSGGTLVVSGTVATTSGAIALESQASTLSLAAAVSTATGTVSVDSASGTSVSAAGTISASGAAPVSFGSIGAGALAISANVTTAGSPVRFYRPVTLGATIAVSAGAGNVSFDQTVDATAPGSQGLTVNSGGTTTFAQAVGGSVRLGALTTDAGGTTRLGPSVRTQDQSISFGDDVVLTQAAQVVSGAAATDFSLTVSGDPVAYALTVQEDVATATGTVSFAGSVDLADLVTFGRAYAVRLLAGGSVAQPVSFLNTGTTTLGDDAADDLLLTGGVTATSGPKSLAGTVRSANAAIDFGATGTTLAADAVTRSGSATTGFAAVTGAFSLTLQNAAGATGAVTFTGAVAIDDLVTFAEAYAVTMNAGCDIAQRVDFINSGAVTLGDADADDFLFRGGLGSQAAGTNLFRGVVRTDGLATHDIELDDLSLGGVLTLNAGLAGQLAFTGTVNVSNASGNASVADANGALDNDLTIDASLVDSAAGTLAVASGATVDLGASGFTIGTLSNGAPLAPGVLRLTGTQATHDFTVFDVDSGITEYYGTDPASLVFTAGFAAGSYFDLRVAGTGAGVHSLEAPIAVGSDLRVQSGVLDVSASDHGIAVSGNWRNDVGFAGFVSRAGTVAFDKSSGIIEVRGNNAWYVFSCTVPGIEIRFENTAAAITQRIVPGGIFRVRGSLVQPIRLDRLTLIAGTPGVPAPGAGDDEHFWFFDLVPGAFLDMEHVDVWYSNARSNPVGIPPNVVAGYQLPPQWDYKWLDKLYALYSYTEDRDYDGKIDRLRITTEAAIGNDFTNFDIEVEGYEIDRSEGVNGFERPAAGVTLYVYLVEKPFLDTGSTPRWRVPPEYLMVSLRDEATGSQQFGTLETGDTDYMTPGDTAWPIIAHTLSIPGNDGTYIRFSEKVVKSAGGTLDAADFGGSPFTPIFDGGGPGAFEGVASLGIRSSGDLASGGFTLSAEASTRDEGLPPLWLPAYSVLYPGAPEPTYPDPATGYLADPNTYAAFGDAPDIAPITRPPFELGRGGKNVHRLSDLLVSVPPTPALAGSWSAANPDSWFAWPSWAKDEAAFPGTTAEYEALTPLEAARSTLGLVRAFDGSQWLRDQDWDLAVRTNPALGLGSLELIYDSNVATRFVSATPGIWLPEFLETDFSGLAAYPNTVVEGGTPSGPVVLDDTAAFAGGAAGDDLWGASFAAGDPEVRSPSTFDFWFRLAGAPTDLYAGRLEMTPGSAALPPDWYRLVRPFTLRIRDIEPQKGGVTVMNNVIDPGKGETVRLNYTLAEAGRVTVLVLTLDGDVVRALYRGTRQPGDYTDVWDGRNAAGNPVARGAYFIRIVGPGLDEIRKVLVVKNP